MPSDNSVSIIFEACCWSIYRGIPVEDWTHFILRLQEQIHDNTESDHSTVQVQDLAPLCEALDEPDELIRKVQNMIGNQSHGSVRVPTESVQEFIRRYENLYADGVNDSMLETIAKRYTPMKVESSARSF